MNACSSVQGGGWVVRGSVPTPTALTATGADSGLDDMPDLTPRDLRLVLAACILGGLLAAFAMIGVVATGCWLWPHRVGVEQAVFWIATGGVVIAAARYGVKRRRR